MGEMKRAEARERLLRTTLATSKTVVLKWRTADHILVVDFLDPRSRQPITLTRRWRDPATLLGLINRSLSALRPGPRAVMVKRQIEEGAGELEILVTAEQYARLQRR